MVYEVYGRHIEGLEEDVERIKSYLELPPYIGPPSMLV